MVLGYDLALGQIEGETNVLCQLHDLQVLQDVSAGAPNCDIIQIGDTQVCRQTLAVLVEGQTEKKRPQRVTLLYTLCRGNEPEREKSSRSGRRERFQGQDHEWPPASYPDELN